MKAFWCLFALGIFLQIPEGQAQCPPGFKVYILRESGMEMCLNFASDVRRDWHEGRKYCKSLGAELACLDYEDLHLQVIDDLYRTQDMLDEGFHVGCTDEVTEGEWLWTDGTKVNLSSCHWYPGQPDSVENQNYCCLYQNNYLYSSCPNGMKLFTLCMI
ncbi:C-type lectin domain family 4 member E-like isoform X3 [Macrobrachium rosenbergii]|uniref:C-type lectin domain family 4 member E-like isoform X3 n=1 Tax=Macrobrachium rosenbergii TaxID=79674 RepID=UPI0034D6CDAD